MLEVTEPDYTITDAMESDTGKYSCRVSGTLGANSTHMQIVVGTKPSFVNPQRSPSVSFVLGQKSRLDCEANGIPTPTVFFKFKNISLVSPNPKINKEICHRYTMLYAYKALKL